MSRPDTDVVRNVIDKDLDRTFPSHVHFKQQKGCVLMKSGCGHDLCVVCVVMSCVLVGVVMSCVGGCGHCEAGTDVAHMKVC